MWPRLLRAAQCVRPPDTQESSAAAFMYLHSNSFLFQTRTALQWPSNGDSNHLSTKINLSY